MDNIFLVTVAVIFLTALLSRVVQKNDRVLKLIKGFHVTIIRKDGKKMWGKAHMYVNGMKLLFSRPYQSSGGCWVESYLFYEEDMQNLQLIFRYQDELSPENRRRRSIEINRVASPGRMRKILRKLRNFISNFQEAFSETLGVFLSRFKSASADLIKANEKHLKLAGSTALNAAGKEYDQILEHHINQKVVVTVTTEKHDKEFSGFLGEYSSNWLALIDCEVDQDWYLPLNDVNKLILNRSLDVSFCVSQENEKFHLTITLSNYGQHDIELIRIEGLEFSQRIQRSIPSNTTIEVMLDELPEHLFPKKCDHIIDKTIENIAPERGGQYHVDQWKTCKDQLPNCELVYRAKRQVDVYLPRTIASVRHGVSIN